MDFVKFVLRTMPICLHLSIVGVVAGQELKPESEEPPSEVEIHIDGFFPAREGAVRFLSYKDGKPAGDRFLKPIPARFAARLKLAHLDYRRILDLSIRHADELELSKEQQKQIIESEGRMGKRMLEISPRLSEPGDPDALVDEMLGAFIGFKAEIFLKHQIKRLDEIQVQEDLSQGTVANLSTKYRDALDISDEQKAALLKRKNELEEEFFAEVSKLVKEHEAKLLEPLDPSQRDEVLEALKMLPRNEDVKDPTVRSQLQYILGL